jgi:hypothetical protein
MLDSPEMADTISMEAQCYLIVLAGRMAQVFPDAGTSPMSVDFNASESVQ